MATPDGDAHKRNRWREARLALLEALAPPLLYAVLWLLSRTLRLDVEGLGGVRERWSRGERVVMTFWHGRQLLVAIAFPRIPEARPCVMVSQHRDGEIATEMLRRWGVATVRGSTTRGAVSGLRGLLRAHRDGHDITMAPDGPRGPRCKVKPGIVHVAKAMSGELFPVGAAGSRVWRLRNWDRMIIPKPFSRLLVIVGNPVAVPRGAGAEDVADACLAVQVALNELSDEAERRVRATR
jgi:lysophospholipid acyltransferase (LPLAT)-like uncharacterized protein